MQKQSCISLILLMAIAFCFGIKPAASQNLVINPSLENYILCPGFGQFSSTYINNWSKPSVGSTDYYHTACPGIYPASQIPLGGNAYLGIIAYNFGTEYREYATGELSAPLLAGIQYTVSFYVSLNDGYIQAVNELGAYLSAVAPGPYPNALHIPVMPQIQNTTGVLGDTTLWKHISGTFTATGGEQFITIGNFNNDSSTTVSLVGNTGSYGAYYFVDDVSVVPFPDGIQEVSTANITVSPSPSHGIVNAEIKEAHQKKFSYAVMDYAGRIIKTENVEIDSGSFHTHINLSTCRNGIYFLKLIIENRLLNYKIVKM